MHEFFSCDVTDAVGFAGQLTNMRREFGKIDILIANAGIGGNDRETRSLEPSAVKQVIDVNLIGSRQFRPCRLTRNARRWQRATCRDIEPGRNSRITRSAAYSASKAGMTAFFESVRLDMAGKGLSVTVIQPGFIKRR